MLVISILIGTIYAGIMLHLQNKMLSLPQIKVQQLAEKEAENVSDYALRMAVRNSIQLGLLANVGTVFDTTVVYNNYRIGNSIIDRVEYRFAGEAGKYRAVTRVRSNLMGTQITYPAEIAFAFPNSSLFGEPDCFYLEMDQPQFNPSPSFNHVIDSSANLNHGLFYGDISTRPMGMGANGWKCASFGSNGGWIEFTGHPSMVVSSNFTVICFAKIRENHQAATIIWLPSDPWDTLTPTAGHPGQNLRYKPSAGIWFSGGQMHFSSVNTSYVQSTVSVPFVPRGRWPHNRDQWIFFGLTYANGRLKAYINGLPVGTSDTASPLPAIPTTNGFTIGRKDIKVLSTMGASEYMYMFGLIDQVGLYSRTLSDAEIWGIYNDILSPASMQYIKD